MTIPATAVYEVRAAGNDTFGGFFVPGTGGTTDYSQQNSAQLAVTDAVANGTTTITSATGGFTSAMVNNGINIAGVLYQITAYTNTNTITVDRNVSTATGLTAKVGGALGSPGYLSGRILAGDGAVGCMIWLNGSFSITTATSNVSNGTISWTGAATSASPTWFEGYGSTRGDGVKATLTTTSGAGSTFTIWSMTTGRYVIVRYVKLVAYNTTIHGFGQAQTNGDKYNYEYCEAVGCNTGFISISGGYYACVASACVKGFDVNLFYGYASSCVALDCTSVGFSATANNNAGTYLHRCLAARCPTGFTVSGNGGTMLQCTAYGCSTAAFSITGNFTGMFTLCAAINSAVGYTKSGSTGIVRLMNCAAFACTTNYTGTGVTVSGTLLTSVSDPCVNPSSNDFSIGTSGTALWNQSLVLPGTITPDRVDVGAYQHQPPPYGLTF